MSASCYRAGAGALWRAILRAVSTSAKITIE